MTKLSFGQNLLQIHHYFRALLLQWSKLMSIEKTIKLK